MTLIFNFSKDKEKIVGHRKIFHSIYGAIIFSFSILIIFIIFLLIFFVALSFYQPQQSSGISVNAVSGSLSKSIQMIKDYWNFVLFFLIGSFIGFIAHLAEDSLTVSGIVYLPFISDIGLKGSLKTGNKEFYETNNTGFLKKSKFGMIMIWVFNIIFILIYSFYSLYLLGFLVIPIYFISIFLFFMVFAGLRPAVINRD